MAEHPLVTQLHFARSEFARGFEGVPAADAARRVLPLNSLGWMVGHLANQEHRYWVKFAQRRDVAPGLNDLVGTGKPASTPEMDEMWAVWRTVTAAADEYLGNLTTTDMETFLHTERGPVPESVGTLLLRNTYHYWFHTGEASAVRQLLGHPDLPEFVGAMDSASYRRDPR